jgi:hypothetical protein
MQNPVFRYNDQLNQAETDLRRHTYRDKGRTIGALYGSGLGLAYAGRRHAQSGKTLTKRAALKAYGTGAGIGLVGGSIAGRVVGTAIARKKPLKKEELSSRADKLVEFRREEPKRELTGLQKIGRIIAPIATGAALIAIASKAMRPKKATPVMGVEGTPLKAATEEIEKQLAGKKAAQKALSKAQKGGKLVRTGKSVRGLQAKVRAYFFNDRDVYGDGRFGAAASAASAFRKGQRALPWLRRGNQVLTDTADIAAGRPPEQPFYKQKWAKRIAAGAAIGAGVYAVRNVPVWANQMDAATKGRGKSLTELYPKTGKIRGKIAEKSPAWLRGDNRVDNRGFRLPLFNAKTGKVVYFDQSADARGWDLRDARGRSARVYAPGSKRRERREKTNSEKVSTIRAVRNAALVAAAGGIAGTGYFMNKSKENARALKGLYRGKIMARGGPKGLVQRQAGDTALKYGKPKPKPKPKPPASPYWRNDQTGIVIRPERFG